MTRSIVFIIDLMQDVNILRPLFGVAAAQAGTEVFVLASHLFHKRDTAGLWRRELDEASALLGFPVYPFATELEAYKHLQGRRGVMVASAESSVSGHALVHNLFLAAPPGFIRATLQHGFECVGFLHNAAHDRSHGRNVTFNADVICGWFSEEVLLSLVPSERSKLLVAGPPLMLPRWDVAPHEDDEPRPEIQAIAGDEVAEIQSEAGVVSQEPEPEPLPSRPACLICENLHSVRMSGTVLKSDFIAQFTDFAHEAERRNLDVWLRPHPAGRFTEVNGTALPPRVQKSTGPIYKEDLSRFSFAVSAPSSILFDMIIAGVPVAVWQDAGGEIDCRNYAGLPVISTIEDWWDFAAAAETERPRLMAQQDEFVRRLNLPENPLERYASLLACSG